MNHAKIAAALHTLAEAFEAEVESVEKAVTGKKSKKLTIETTATADVAAAIKATPAPDPEPVVIEEAPPAPVTPAVTIKELNAAVLKVAAKNRDRAVAILGSFGLTTTVGLAQEKFQAVYDAFEEEIAKLDAAAVQVAQASLV